MKEKILIGKNEFTLGTDGDYVGVMDIWGKDTKVFLDIKEDQDGVIDTVVEKMIDVFMEDNYQYVDVINDMIEKGTFRAYAPISENDFREALVIDNVCIFIRGRNSEFTLDLDAQPDYLLGHLGNMEIDSRYEVEFGGLNG